MSEQPVRDPAFVTLQRFIVETTGLAYYLRRPEDLTTRIRQT